MNKYFVIIFVLMIGCYYKDESIADKNIIINVEDASSNENCNFIDASKSIQLNDLVRYQPIDAAVPDSAHSKPVAFIYGESHVSFPPFLAQWTNDMGTNWIASSYSRPGHTTQETFFTAPTDLLLFNSQINYSRKVLVFYSGTNDFYRGVLNTKFVCNSWERFTKERIAEGWDVILTTPMKATNVITSPTTSGARWGDIRSCILHDAVKLWKAHSVIDLGGDPYLQDPTDPLVFQQPGGTHLTLLGYSHVEARFVSEVKSLYVAP